MAYEFKKLSDVNVVESISDTTNVLIEDSGEIVKIVAKNLIPSDVVTQSEMDAAIAAIPEPVTSWNDLTDKPFGTALIEQRTTRYEGRGSSYPLGTFMVEDGDRYIVTVNGVEHEATSTANLPYMSINGENFSLSSMLPECMWGSSSEYITSAESLKIELVTYVETTNTLNPKYLPNSISVSWNNLTDRPFYDSNATVTWSSDSTLSGIGWNHVSDLTPRKEELIGAEYNWSSVTDGIMTYTISSVTENTSGDAYDYRSIAVALKDDVTLASGTILEKAGIYFRYADDGYSHVSNLKWGELVTVDEKFIPDTIARVTDIPKAPAVADAVGETPTATEFNTLLAALRSVGLLAT